MGQGGFTPQTAQAAGAFGQPGPFDFEAKVGDVLAKFKSADMIQLTYSGTSKAVDLENWVMKTRMLLNSRHSASARWFDLSVMNARQAYDVYLH